VTFVQWYSRIRFGLLAQSGAAEQRHITPRWLSGYQEHLDFRTALDFSGVRRTSCRSDLRLKGRGFGAGLRFREYCVIWQISRTPIPSSPTDGLTTRQSSPTSHPRLQSRPFCSLAAAGVIYRDSSSHPRLTSWRRPRLPSLKTCRVKDIMSLRVNWHPRPMD